MTTSNQVQGREAGVGALTTAAMLGLYAEVKRLVKSVKVDINEKDEYGDTALHTSVSKGRLAIVKFLLENGADVNAKNEAGSTPLHKVILAKHDQLNILRVLLSYDADTTVRNSSGFLPEQKLILGDDYVTDEIHILKSKHNRIIGKKGGTIEDIRAETGTQIVIPDAHDPSDAIALHGRRAGIDRAKVMIIEATREPKEFEEDYNKNDGKTSVKYPLAKEKHKIVIGKQGATINEIRNETGAEVIMPPQGSDDSQIVIRGDVDQIEAAIKLIQIKIDVAQRARKLQLQRDREAQQRESSRSSTSSTTTGGSRPGPRGGKE
eukprot:TRINITY_DN279_c2_g1_i5.p1 TRINITY_DN279_c2_g1~~TRINITY_DN279_c2_g1_i5.p1  ORF type:complete len:321 (-),score=99.17 TRINITY_DN279_c2_g1_i5:311-1273(-)